MKIFRMVGVAVTVFLLVSTATPLWNRLGTAFSVEPQIGNAEAIVVLGGGVDGPILSDESLRRFVHGIELYREGRAPLLVLCGPPDSHNSEPPEAEIRKAMAVRLGVPEERIATLANVSTTRDEAQQTAATLVKDGGTILLVTGSLHMRRAMGVFERSGLRVLPAPSDDWPRYVGGPQGRILLLKQLLEQAGGLLYYRLSGYI